MKRITDGLLHTIELLLLTAGIVSTTSIPLIVSLLVVALIPASKLQDDLRGNEIKNSIFSVSSTGKIQQNSLAKITRLIPILFDKDKNKRFIDETLNMFLEIKQKNNKGDNIIYNTKSQAMTLMLLRKLEKHGYIDNLIYEKSNKSRLIIEQLLIGNIKNIFSNKKHQMYNISFTLTDKERNKEDLLNLLNKKEELKPEKKKEVEEPVDEKALEGKNIAIRREELYKIKEELQSIKEQQLSNEEEISKSK